MEYRKKIPCSIIRGGTSKGLYFLEEDIPKAGSERDEFLLQVMGSPDKKQINGLGGGASVTSKVAIIKRSKKRGVDVEYTFAQVSVDKPLVSYKGNCGNISAGVGPFAIEKGLVEAVSPITEVKILNTNTNKLIVEEVLVENGQVQYQGKCKIAGVPGSGAPIKMKFWQPSGTLGKGLLPTGNVVDHLDVPGIGLVEVSIIDAANPLVFVNAKDLGLNGTELPAELDAQKEKLVLLETVRGMAAQKLNLISDYRRSAWDSPGIPKMTLVSQAQKYQTTGGMKISENEIDLMGRMMSMQKTHPAYAMTGAMCTVAAAAVKGSVVNKVLNLKRDLHILKIGHPSGILEAEIEYEENGLIPNIIFTAGFRTANLLMEGWVVLEKSY